MGTENKKTVLAIDTAMGGVSVGIVAANGHIVSRMVETSRGQAAILVPILQEVVEEALCEFKDIDLIVCSKGPGSFTGLRIGLATARTMALSLSKPLVGLNTLDTMAHHYPTGKPLLVVLETKRQDFYGRYYDGKRQALSKPMALDAEDILTQAPVEDFDVGGDCLERFNDSILGDLNCLDNFMQPDPILMAQIGLKQYEAQGVDERVDPLYLRGADVSQPKNTPRRLAQS